MNIVLNVTFKDTLTTLLGAQNMKVASRSRRVRHVALHANSTSEKIDHATGIIAHIATAGTRPRGFKGDMAIPRTPSTRSWSISEYGRESSVVAG